MFLKKCASNIPVARKKGRLGHMRPATDLVERVSKRARSILPALPNTMFIVVICQVSNGKDVVLSPNQLKPVYTNVRHWEELIDFLDKNGRPEEPYTLTSRFKCTLEKYKLDQEYMGLYTNGQMKTVPIYGQIFYNCCHPNAFKLKLGQDLKIFWSK
jgi:hypothetical protein